MMVNSLETIERKKIGEYLKRERKRKGIKSSLLVEDGLSQSTISNIERGVLSVDISRIIRLSEKLDIDVDQMVHDLQEIDQNRENVQEQLQGIESLLAHNLSTEKCLEMLNEIQNKHSMNTPYVFYLRGKCYIRTKQWDKAKLALRQSVEICESNKDNMKSASLYELSRVCYYIKEFDLALEYVDQGLFHFNDTGDRKYIRYNLYIMKVYILEAQEKFGEALSAIIKLWEFMQEIDDMRLVLTMYEKRALFLIKLGMFEDSVEFLLEGIEKARRNEFLDRSCELWTILSNAHLQMGKLTSAKSDIEIAIEMIENCNEKVKAYAHLTYGKVLKKEHPETAIEQFEIANRLARSHKMLDYIVDSYILLGDCLMESGKLKKALKEYKNAENVITKIGNKNKELDVAWRICKCLEELSEGKEENNKELLHEHYKNIVQLIKGLKGVV